MEKTTPATTEINGPESSTIAVLNQILALPTDQRKALRNAWSALDAGLVFDSSLYPPDASNELVAIGASDIADQPDIGDWIAEKRLLPPRQQMGELKMAIEQEEDILVLSRLRKELSEAKDANLLLTAELAITEYAYANPLQALVLLAVIGIAVLRGVGWLKVWLA
ncbi:MAG: hypothetical protein QE279_08390 [Rhodoferax sp.]|nr:hypothetical protein [Rhodoferax sp.]